MDCIGVAMWIHDDLRLPNPDPDPRAWWGWRRAFRKLREDEPTLCGDLIEMELKICGKAQTHLGVAATDTRRCWSARLGAGFVCERIIPATIRGRFRRHDYRPASPVPHRAR